MKNFRIYMLVALFGALCVSAHAQQVNTLYFLENAPMRHTLNPAFQPVSNGYVNFTPLGWMQLGVGTNTLTMQDVLTYDKSLGKTIINPLHPNGDKQAFLRAMRSMNWVGGDVTFSWVNFGFRLHDVGYVTVGINQRIDFGGTIPKSLFQFMLGGGMTDLTPNGVNTLGLAGLGVGGSVYTEIGGGYSHKLNDQWTIGGKFKFLLGTMNMGFNAKKLSINANVNEWALQGTLNVDMAGPINFDKLPAMENRTLDDVINDMTGSGSGSGIQMDQLINTSNIGKLLTPSGYGAAIDFGFTYKPLEQLQITAAINDLGFIYWTNAKRYSASVDTTFVGVGEFDYGDPAFKDSEGNFSTQLLIDSAMTNLRGLTGGVKLHGAGSGYAKMVSARFNIGLDANFWDNRVGVGIVSATRLYNARLYEEITLGVSFRPFNWLNIAATYSLMNNGKFSNIGAGLSIMPYDGINMTLAMDYIPTSYAGMPKSDGSLMYVIPDKAKMVNIALGFSICWGTNRKDSDKDGVWDKIDMCPNTPRGVQVDSVGCPLDEDHDGVPDYLDHCLGTRPEAIGFVDSVGCDLDSDGDGVEDWRDLCPNTPEAAWGKVDSVGCPLDTDGDGVPDYLDECPDTPKEAYGMIDSKGCPIDSDGDGVPDYLDQCPGTPEAAWGKVDEKGCPLDSDGDGVPDYIDECPDTPKEAWGKIDARGCELDSDGDGIVDWKDECPYVPGPKENKGCPEIKREVRQLLQKAMQGIEFETGKATIKPKSFPLLNQIAAIFIENSNYIIEVQGHTDNVGKADYNMRLSDNRANSVMNYLVGKGVPAERMTAHGYGMDVPIADNSTKAGRQKNRRVEFKITFEEVHVETILDHADPKPEAAPQSNGDSQPAPEQKAE